MVRQTFKVKSIQSFKQPVPVARAGDRAALCLPSLSPDKLERTYVSQPGLLQTVSACVCEVDKCRFYTGALSPGPCSAVSPVPSLLVFARAASTSVSSRPTSGMDLI